MNYQSSESEHLEPKENPKNTPLPPTPHPETQSETDRTRADALKKLHVIKTECAQFGSKGRLRKHEFSDASAMAAKIDDVKSFVSSYRAHLEEHGRFAKRLVDFMADYVSESHHDQPWYMSEEYEA